MDETGTAPDIANPHLPQTAYVSIAVLTPHGPEILNDFATFGSAYGDIVYLDFHAR